MHALALQVCDCGRPFTDFEANTHYVDLFHVDLWLSCCLSLIPVSCASAFAGCDASKLPNPSSHSQWPGNGACNAAKDGDRCVAICDEGYSPALDSGTGLPKPPSTLCSVSKEGSGVVTWQKVEGTCLANGKLACRVWHHHHCPTSCVYMRCQLVDQIVG